MDHQAPLLTLKGISRRFPGVLALDHVAFDLLPGEVHALVGENGAGKSTLINILAGVHQPSGGILELGGRPTVLPDPVSAQRAGINVILQEFNLLPHLSVAENIFLNREPLRVAHRLAHALPADRPGVGAAQDRAQPAHHRARAARGPAAARRDRPRRWRSTARVVVMDEPTAALSKVEIGRLLELVRSTCRPGRRRDLRVAQAVGGIRCSGPRHRAARRQAHPDCTAGSTNRAPSSDRAG